MTGKGNSSSTAGRTRAPKADPSNSKRPGGSARSTTPRPKAASSPRPGTGIPDGAAQPCQCWRMIDFEGGLSALDAIQGYEVKGTSSSVLVDVLASQLSRAKDRLLTHRPLLERLRRIDEGSSENTPNHEATAGFIQDLETTGRLFATHFNHQVEAASALSEVLSLLPSDQQTGVAQLLEQEAKWAEEFSPRATEFHEYVMAQAERFREPLGGLDLLRSLFGGFPGAGGIDGMPSGMRVAFIPVERRQVPGTR